jgi:peptidoglycan biosynthesis protein MviN/MurJ (putative lipid II flippase)
MVWVTFFVLLAKLAGAGKEIVVAAHYGIGPTVDAYGLVYSVVMWPVGMTLSVLTTVLIPLEARLTAQDPAARTLFRREMLAALIALGLVLGGVLWLALPQALRQAAPPTVWAVAERMVPTLATTASLALLTTLYSVWIMAGGRYANTAIEGVPALVLMAVLLVAPLGDAAWLVSGTLAGVVVQLAVLAGLQVHSGDATWPLARFSSPAWRQMAAGLSLTLLGQALIGSTPMIETFIAARVGEGAVSTLGYANRVLGLFTGLVVLAVTRAMLPVLSEAAATKSGNAHEIVVVWLGRLALAGLVLAAFRWTGAELITRSLFQRGQFTAADTSAVAAALRYAALQLPTYLPSIVLTSYAAASGHFGAIFVSAVVGFVVRPVAGWFLSAAMGVPGLVLAQGVAYACTLAFLLAWMLWHRRRVSAA